jgi:hypothetical protein
VNIAGNFEAEALRILRQVPGVMVDPQPSARDRGVDAIVRFADREAEIAVEVKLRATTATAWQLVQYARDHPERPLLLIAENTTAEARKILEDNGIALVDGLGNAHMELPGLMFHIEGRRRTSERDRKPLPPTRLSRKAGVVAQALLLNPTREWTVQDLAEEADVSPGLAHRVLARLDADGIVATEGAGPARVRHVVNPTALLDLWAEEQVDHPIRNYGYLLAQTPQQLIGMLDENLEAARIDHAVTGAAAANLLAPFVTAIPIVDIWVTSTAAPEEIHAGAKTDPVSQGHNVVFLQAKDETPLVFHRQVDEVTLANPFRVYADLQRDPRRGREQADHLRERVIGF